MFSGESSGGAEAFLRVSEWPEEKSGFGADAHDWRARQEVQFKRMEEKIHDIRVYFERAQAEGEAIGFEKGRSEGAAQETREIAKNFKQAGIPIEVIAENTGLSAEEVEAL